jgi:Ca2+-binding RTX toxin-like protein
VVQFIPSAPHVEFRDVTNNRILSGGSQVNTNTWKVTTCALAAGSHTIEAQVFGFGTVSGIGDGLLASASLNRVVLVSGIAAVGTQLFIVGTNGKDQILVTPIGASTTGSTGVQINATLNGVSSSITFQQAFTAIQVFGFGGNDNIQLVGLLVIPTFLSEGNGNDSVTLGDGANNLNFGNGNANVRFGKGDNTVTLGNGNNIVTAGNGNNDISVGSGNNAVWVGNGTNVILEGNGRDVVRGGDGANIVVAGVGPHTADVGNGNDILVDGSVTLAQAGDSLEQILADWAAQDQDVATMRTRLSVIFNAAYANDLWAGSGIDWFYFQAPNDSGNPKATDQVN